MTIFNKAGRTTEAKSLQASTQKWPWYFAPFGYLLMSLGLTWPLLPKFLTAIPRGLPDSYQNIWNFWWIRTALFERRINPYYTDMLFYPYRDSANPMPLYLHTLQPALSLPGGLLSWLFDYAFAYNLIILVGFVASGWTTFALTRYFPSAVTLTNQIAAFVAGAFYTFSAFHWHNLAQGQTSVFWLQWLPLYILLLHKSFSFQSSVVSRQSENNNPLSSFLFPLSSFLFPALAVITLWLCFMTDWYYFVYLGLYSVGLYLFLLFRAWRRRKAGTEADDFYNWRQLTLRAGAIGLVTLLLIAPVLWGLLRASRDAAIIFQDSIEEDILQSADLSALFDPLQSAKSFYLGYVLLAMAAIGLWVTLRHRARTDGPKWGGWWLGVVVITLLLSFGPYLLFSHPDDPTTVQGGLPMPYQLFHSIPLLSLSRSPVRFLAMTTLGLSLFAGWGLAWVVSVVSYQLSVVSRWLVVRGFGLVAVPALVLGLFLVETQPLPLVLDNLYYPKILDEFARDPDKSYGLLELPITTHYTRDTRRMFFQSIHHQPMTSGYISRRVIQFYDDNEPLGRFFGRFPFSPEPIFPGSDNNLVQLKTLQLYRQLYNFRYVLHYRDEYGADLAGAEKYEGYLESILGAKAKIFDDGRTSAYQIPTTPDIGPALLLSTAGGYDAQKLEDGQDYRWARQRMEVQILAIREIEVQLDFIAWSLPPDNQLEVQSELNPLQSLPLEQSPQPHSVRLKLKAGRNFIVFNSLRAGSFPQDLGLPYSDSRKLAIAMGNLQLKILNNRDS